MKTKIVLFIAACLLAFHPIFSQNTNYGTGAGNTSDRNTSIGYYAGNSVGGPDNTFVGHESGYSLLGWSYNTFAGSYSGYNTTGNSNSFFGYRAGFSSEGSLNSFFGNRSGYYNDGQYNSFLGSYSGEDNLGDYNLYLGYYAGSNSTTGSANVYLGSFTGGSNLTGSNNVMLGYSAGNNSSGSGNVFIGNNAGYNETGSDKLVIHNSGILTNPLLYGDFASRRLGIGTSSLGTYTLSVNGDAFATGVWVSSDKRFKQNEQVIEGALEKVNSLSGFSYEFKQGEEAQGKIFSKGTQLGFLAQDLQKVFPQLVKDDGGGYLAVNYQGMVPVLVEAIKELSAKLQQQSTELELLKQSISNPTELATKASLGRLHQNIPNPSGSETRIAYELSETARGGMLFIFDMQGRTIARYQVSQRQGEIIIPAGQLASGLYHYSLIIDGKIIDTRKMILTK